MVERYRFWCQDSDAEVSREPNGGWVRHEDYGRLQEQVETLRKERDEAIWAGSAEIDKRAEAEAERDRLREALKERAAWHKCSCPEPCDDYNVFPGGCPGRYAADYLALQKEPQP